MWFGATNACTYALGSIFFNSARDAFVWQWLQLPSLQQKLQTHKNLQGDISISALELAAHVMQFLLKIPHMNPLEHTLDRVDITAVYN